MSIIWENILKINIEELLQVMIILNKDETNLVTQMERIYQEIASATIDPGDENTSVENLCHLFRITQVALQHKNDNMIEQKELLKEKDIQLKDQEIQLKRLKVKRKDLDPSSTNMRSLQEELIDLERKYETSLRDLENAEEVLEQEREISANIKATANEEKSKLSMLQNSNRKLEADLRETKMQLSSQRSKLHNRQTDEETQNNIIHQKNQEMAKFVDEIDMLSTENDQLAAEMTDVTAELEAAMEEIEKGNEELNTLRRVVQDSDLRADELNDERDALKIRVEDFSDQLERLQTEKNYTIKKLETKLKLNAVELTTLSDINKNLEFQIKEHKQSIKTLQNTEILDLMNELKMEINNKGFRLLI
jgi:chromosome segregation ATPase